MADFGTTFTTIFQNINPPSFAAFSSDANYSGFYKISIANQGSADVFVKNANDQYTAIPAGGVIVIGNGTNPHTRIDISANAQQVQVIYNLG